MRPQQCRRVAKTLRHDSGRCWHVREPGGSNRQIETEISRCRCLGRRVIKPVRPGSQRCAPSLMGSFRTFIRREVSSSGLRNRKLDAASWPRMKCDVSCRRGWEQKSFSVQSLLPSALRLSCISFFFFLSLRYHLCGRARCGIQNLWNRICSKLK